VIPKKNAWEKIPKSIQSAIVQVVLVAITLVSTQAPEEGNRVELEQHINGLENENIQLQNTQQPLSAEIEELRRAMETNSSPNDQFSTCQFKFALSNPDRNFLQQLIRVDSEYRKRNNRRVMSEYQEKARELYIDSRQE